MSAEMAGTDPDCGEEARDPRDHGDRTWDALVEACQRLQDAEVLPESHGTKPRLTLTLDYDALKTGVGTGLSAAVVRRLPCDADLIPAILKSARRSSGTGGCKAAWARKSEAWRRSRHGKPSGQGRVAADHRRDRRPPHHPLGRRRPDQPGQPR